jgi:hypothetical protein
MPIQTEAQVCGQQRQSDLSSTPAETLELRDVVNLRGLRWTCFAKELEMSGPSVDAAKQSGWLARM